MNQGFLWKFEKFFFLLFVIITALPLLCNMYFPTVDGPAHLHNGNLLKHLWFLGNNFGNSFFDFNTHLNSNLLDHAWFAFFGLFLPSWLVEKSILLAYVISMPFSFRYLVKKITGDQQSAKIASYLIFSFVYSFTLRIGFFNFCIGIPVLFWTLGFWTASRDRLNARKLLVLTALATLLYVSHLFNFMLFAIILCVTELQYILYSKTQQGNISKLKYPALILAPGIVLTVLFYISNSAYEHAAPRYIPAKGLLLALSDLSPLITLNYDKEVLFAHIILYALSALLVLVIIDFFRKRKEPKGFRPMWVVPAMLVLVLYFAFPDWVASGGFISVRWELYFFLLLLVLIAAKGLPVKQLLLPVAVVLTVHLFFMNYHNEQTAYLSADAETLAEAEKQMEDNSVLLPLNYSDNWILTNHAGYLSAEKNIIDLDNYEAAKPHFPLIWKTGEAVYDLMPGYANKIPPCINIDAYEQKTKHGIGYISRFGFNGNASDSCTAAVEKELNSRFEIIYQSENKRLQLYKRKPGT